MSLPIEVREAAEQAAGTFAIALGLFGLSVLGSGRLFAFARLVGGFALAVYAASLVLGLVDNPSNTLGRPVDEFVLGPGGPVTAIGATAIALGGLIGLFRRGV